MFCAKLQKKIGFTVLCGSEKRLARFFADLPHARQRAMPISQTVGFEAMGAMISQAKCISAFAYFSWSKLLLQLK